MSKYTTEVRFICEQKAGLTESAGWNSVDEIIRNSYDKIFDVPSIPFFNAEHGALLLQKILLHYYSREIGYETVGLWQMKLNQKMREIMPYYNQLYESETLNYNPLTNVDSMDEHWGEHENFIQRHHTTEDRGTVKDDFNSSYLPRHKETMHDGKVKTGVNTDNGATRDGNTWTTFSDTPQGALTGVRDENYLTNATHVSDSPAYVGTVTSMDGNDPSTVEYNKEHKDATNNNYSDLSNSLNTKTLGTTRTFDQKRNSNGDDGTDHYKDKHTGKIGTETYQEMVMKYRETFLNIDMMIINELGDLFMKVW